MTEEPLLAGHTRSSAAAPPPFQAVMWPDGLAHRGPDELGEPTQLGIGGHGPANQPIVEDLILESEQPFERLALCSVELHVSAREKSLKQQVKLQHAAPALPTQTLNLALIELSHTDCSSISSLMWPMARVGFRPFGQTSTQFMML